MVGSDCCSPSRNSASSNRRPSAAARSRASSPTAASSTGAGCCAARGNDTTSATSPTHRIRPLQANRVRRRRQKLTHVLRNAGGRMLAVESHQGRLRGGEKLRGGGPLPFDGVSEGDLPRRHLANPAADPDQVVVTRRATIAYLEIGHGQVHS